MPECSMHSNYIDIYSFIIDLVFIELLGFKVDDVSIDNQCGLCQVKCTVVFVDRMTKMTHFHSLCHKGLTLFRQVTALRRRFSGSS